MTRVLLCALLAGTAPALAAQSGADDAPAFAIMLAQTSGGWTAECSRLAACQARVTDTGIEPVPWRRSL